MGCNCCHSSSAAHPSSYSASCTTTQCHPTAPNVPSGHSACHAYCNLSSSHPGNPCHHHVRGSLLGLLHVGCDRIQRRMGLLRYLGLHGKANNPPTLSYVVDKMEVERESKTKKTKGPKRKGIQIKEIGEQRPHSTKKNGPKKKGRPE